MAVVVTHDPVDALVLADRIVIVEDGAVVQDGSALDVTSRPRSSFAADVAGLNLFRGRSTDGVVHVGEGLVLITPTTVDGDVFAVIHPHAITLHGERPAGSARNVWPARIDDIDVRAGIARVRLRIDGCPLVAEITADSAGTLGLVAGGETWASLKATEIDVFPA
jgi:molybdate transport system ATP-binding protein